MFIDTHCHINTIIKKEFDVPLTPDLLPHAEPLIQEALRNHVTEIINVGTSLTESKNCLLLATTYPSIWATLGTHPNDVKQSWKDDIAEYKKMLNGPHAERIVGIGEIGLDYHYPEFDKQLQYDAFRAQIELALEYDRAIVIHTRNAHDETLHVLEEYKKNGIRGIIHCFSETESFANHALELGFVLGIGGTLTYPKNEHLRAIFKTVPLEKIVLETDAPFLPPQYMRGKINTPAQIAHIAQYLADLRNTTIQEVATATTTTARTLFRLNSL